ncbi:MAG: hypothetical protein KKC37_10130, partial [Proteobacteria bacterium]|nr:hypothetical protein [Pseudomonadota bacterium]
NYPAALSLMWSAAVLADLGAHVSHLEFLGRTKGLGAMAVAFRGYLTRGVFFRNFEARLKARPVRNLNDLITVADAYLFFNAARGLSQTTWMMHRKLRRSPNRNFSVRLIVDGTKYAVLARNLVSLMDSLLAVGLGHSGPVLPPENKLTAWAKMMFRAAQANLGYIEAAIFGPAARRRGRSARRLKGWWLDRDLHYLVALRCFDSVRAIMNRGGAGLHLSAAVLGGAVGSWSLSALVVAKHDSLWVKVDPAGRIKALGNPAGLERLLLSGRTRLRAGLIRARAAGFLPVMPIFHLRVAEYSARPGAALSDRLSALSEYWLGSTWGRLFIVLGR